MPLWPKLPWREWKYEAQRTGHIEIPGTSVIYYFCEARDNLDVRYIGRTNNPLVRRRNHFLSQAGTSYVARWLRSCQQRGTEIEMRIILRVPNELIAAAEQAAIWYGYYAGWCLTNETQGGEGSVGWRHSDSTKQKCREATQRAWAAGCFENVVITDEWRQHVREGVLRQFAEGRVQSFETRQRASLAKAAKWRAEREAAGWISQNALIELVARAAETGINRAYATLRLNGVKSGKYVPLDVQARVWKAYDDLGDAVSQLRVVRQL